MLLVCYRLSVESIPAMSNSYSVQDFYHLGTYRILNVPTFFLRALVTFAMARDRE